MPTSGKLSSMKGSQSWKGSNSRRKMNNKLQITGLEEISFLSYSDMTVAADLGQQRAGEDKPESHMIKFEPCTFHSGVRMRALFQSLPRGLD